MRFVGDSVSKVFYPRATEAKRDKKLAIVTLETFQNLLGIGLAPILLLATIAPELFGYVFGSKWIEAGDYVRWLSLWVIFVLASSPISNIYSVLERQQIGLLFNIILFCTRSIALIIGGLMEDALLAISLFGSISALVWILNCFFILSIAGNSVKIIASTILKELLIAAPFILLAFIFKIIFEKHFWEILFIMFVFILFCIVGLYRLKFIFR